MKKIGFITLGCKVNIYESNALKNELESNGFLVCEATDDCDAYVINTCSVTNMADAKSRKMIRKCIKMNPNAVVAVMGCFSQTNSDATSIEGVDIMIGNGNKHEAIERLINALNTGVREKYINILDILEMNEYEPLEITSYDHTRAFVKIEDGCENFCTYCIIPFARGPVRCKKADDIIAELKRITDNGYLEVVLSGIHTGRYKDNDTKFSDLVERILIEVPKLKRLRISSIEPNEVDSKFLKLMKNSNVIANHIHLPLQSGSNKTLKNMERRYDKEFYINKVKELREARPDIAISTDIIVGFPYETEDDFMETYNLSKELGLMKLHVFPYSMRKGTKAADMPQVNDTVKKDRATRLIALSDTLEYEYASNYIGKVLDLIPEQKSGNNKMIGHTSNFLQVITDYNENYIGKQVNVVIESVVGNKVFGKIVEK